MEKEFIRAAKQGDLAKIKELLAQDPALLDARDSDGSTALHWATWKGHLPVVEALLAAGADVNAQNQNGHWGTTPLHAAAHGNQAPIAEVLIRHGADLCALDSRGKTPMHHTTVHNAKAAAKVIASHGGE